VGVDVGTSIVIDRPVAVVAGYAADPDRAPEWYENISSVEWLTPAPLSLGSRLTFHARFLGRSLTYTYEVVDLVPGERLAMRTAEGPFPMETRYAWTSVDGGRTRMTLRNVGAPSGFARAMTPLIAPAMRRANRKDLRRLKSVLEAGGA
jgi:uncharacterized membrane protein